MSGGSPVSTQSERMPLVESLEVLHEARTEEVLVTTMGSGREWTRFEPHPLDLVYVPSSMGQATSVGLGLALAQPDRKVVVCNGDGSMLMNLGSLITITAQAPTNLLVILIDNGVYEVTGRQAMPSSAELRADETAIDFAAVAKSCGFRKVFRFSELAEWKSRVGEVLNEQGPTFCLLRVEPVQGDTGPKMPGPPWERARSLKQALGRTSNIQHPTLNIEHRTLNIEH